MRPDAEQAQMLERLDAFCEKLSAPVKKGFWRKKVASPGGFYLHGGVGRGKTMVMDLFFTHAPVVQKRRVHFHAFMLELHDFMHERRRALQKKDRIDSDLIAFAEKVAGEARLLCFDEFFVKDVADAMILGRLFTALFDLGVAVVMTSNIPPDELYKDGLQRDRFLPFIALLKDKLDIVHVADGQDYRLGRMRDMDVYYWPHGDDARAQMQKVFDAVADGEKAASITLDAKGRHIYVPHAAKEVCWFTFAELCETPKSAVDYLALATRFKVFIIENVPHLDDRRRDAMTRFVTLIDALYDRHVHAVMSAAAPPDKLYKGADTVTFSRTASRLVEMQSKEYRA